MMSSKSSFELIPGNHMISGKHSIIGLTELLRGKMGFVGFRAWHGQQRKLGLDCTNPSICIEGFLRPVEQRRLCPKEIQVRSRLRLVVMASTLLLLLLRLNQLVKQLGLGG